MDTTLGRDLAAPMRRMTLDGVTYELKFSNRAARLAEDVYADAYGMPPEKCSYMHIVSEAAAGRIRALQAIYYGALIAGGCKMAWEDFDRVFTLDAIEGVRERILQAISDSLPPDEAKKVLSQLLTPTDGHGAG